MCGMLGKLKISQYSAYACGEIRFCFNCLELGVVILVHCELGTGRIDEAIGTCF